jgi:hypothetical protein
LIFESFAFVKTDRTQMNGAGPLAKRRPASL